MYMENNKNAGSGFINQIFVPAMWILSLIGTAMLTLLAMTIHQKNVQKQIEEARFVHSQLNVLTGHTHFLNLTMGDYVVTEADTALVEYGRKVIQHLEEIRLLSPFIPARDSAKVLRDMYLRHFPMHKDAIHSLEFMTGDLIVRHNNDFHSELFRKMSVGEKKYSHLGIIERVSTDSILVHHAVADDFTGIGGVMTHTLSGFMPRGEFDMAVYRYTDDPYTQQQILNAVLDVQKRKIPFDIMFDISDTTRMYCAEMIAYTINKTFNRQMIVPTGTFMNRPVYTVEDCYKVSGIRLVYKRAGVTTSGS